MAAVGVQPIVLKNFVVQIGTDDFAAAVPSVVFTPDQAIQTWKGGTPSAVFTDLSNPTWTCAMRVAQDWDNVSSLVNYLLANAGTQKSCIFKPNKKATGTMFQVAATLILATPPIGGDVDAWAEAAITHGVVGAPVTSVA